MHKKEHFYNYKNKLIYFVCCLLNDTYLKFVSCALIAKIMKHKLLQLKVFIFATIVKFYTKIIFYIRLSMSIIVITKSYCNTLCTFYKWIVN